MDRGRKSSLLIIVVVVVVGCGIVAASAPARSTAMSFLDSLFKRGPDVRALHKAGAVVVDVRNPDEWQAGHLDGSTLVPLPSLPARIADVEKLVGGDKTKPVLVVCRSGGRAGSARSILQAQGFTNVHNAGSWTSLR